MGSGLSRTHHVWFTGLRGFVKDLTPPSPWLREILTLDPEQDAQRIVHIDTVYEFPFDTTRSLEFALFRTFGSPAVSRLLDETQEFATRAQRRYDDTDLILSTIVESGYDSDEGKRAIRRMNRLHRRFDIANEDFLYVLSTFVYEPIRWNERFGWRRFVERERLAMFHYWREVGRRMAITEIPPTYEEFEQYNVEYERSNFRFTESNARVARVARHVPRVVPGTSETLRRARDRGLDGRSTARGHRLPTPAAPARLRGRGRAASPRPGDTTPAAAAQAEAAHAAPASHVSAGLPRRGARPYAARRNLRRSRSLTGIRAMSSGRIGAAASRQSWHRRDAERSSAGDRASPHARQRLVDGGSLVASRTMA